MKKIISLLIISIIFCGVLITNPVLAWGPERALFTNESPATYATFNSITDNAAVGDERDFVRIVEIGSGNAFSNEITVEPGKEYQVFIYYHNDASSTYNTRDYDYAGVAREVKVKTQFSTVVTPEEQGMVSATISASNTYPLKVWDEAYMNSTETVYLSYKSGSAKIYNDWGANGSVLSTNLFSANGTYLGLDSLNGIILGCDEYSGQVVYTLVASGEDTPTPVDPEPEPVDPVDPEPEILPETGPAEIILAGVIILGVLGGAIYFWVSEKTLRRVRNSVMNEPDEKN